MNPVEITLIAISEQGHLLVKPMGTRKDRESLFPYIYRMATGAFWNSEEEAFSSPVPKEWSYYQWLENIAQCAMSELGIELFLTENTEWVSVPEDEKQQMEIHYRRSDA